LEIIVRPATGVTETTTGGLFGRVFGRQGKTARYDMAARQVFDQAAAPALPAIYRHGQRVEPEPEPRGVSMDALEPGETRTAKTLRMLAMSDVVVPGIFSAGTGLVLGAGVGVMAIVNRWSWLWPFGFWFGSTIVCWAASTWRIWWPSGLVAHIEELTRLDWNGDGMIGDEKPSAPEPVIEMVQQKKREGRVHERRSRLPKVKAGPEALARWFWRIVREGGRSFSIRAAANYRITPDEVAAVQGYFIGEGQAEKGANNWVIPTEEGLDAMWSIVRRYYPDARLPPDREDGVQNTDQETDTQTDTQEWMGEG
jgi:hypothetical protein